MCNKVLGNLVHSCCKFYCCHGNPLKTHLFSIRRLSKDRYFPQFCIQIRSHIQLFNFGSPDSFPDSAVYRLTCRIPSHDKAPGTKETNDLRLCEVFNNKQFQETIIVLTPNAQVIENETHVGIHKFICMHDHV